MNRQHLLLRNHFLRRHCLRHGEQHCEEHSKALQDLFRQNAESLQNLLSARHGAWRQGGTNLVVAATAIDLMSRERLRVLADWTDIDRQRQ